ncbi:MAG TPA: hypothetical protein VE687_12905 [Stellaceae bacterium]|nr:hypothetical protein [Stellaceae bacterium]
MSIPSASPSPCPPPLLRELRFLSALSLGVAALAIPVPVFTRALGVLSALMGFVIFAALLVEVERGVAAHRPHTRLGDANRITLARAAIACLIAARRQQLASAFGARFDMEVDALALLVLSVTVVQADCSPTRSPPTSPSCWALLRIGEIEYDGWHKAPRAI